MIKMRGATYYNSLMELAKNGDGPDESEPKFSAAWTLRKRKLTELLSANAQEQKKEHNKSMITYQFTTPLNSTDLPSNFASIIQEMSKKDGISSIKLKQFSNKRLSHFAKICTMSKPMSHVKKVINTFLAIMMASTAPTAQMIISSHASSVPARSCAGCGS